MPDRTDSPTDRATGVRKIVLGLIAFASASAYLTRYCISAANTTIQQDVGLNDQQMGELMSVFAVGYFFFQIPGGWLGNRFGTRFAFAFLSICWSLSNFWTGIVSQFNLLWASRFSLGVFQAGMVPLSAKILRDWIPISARGVGSAVIGSCMSLGGAFTLWFTGWLLAADVGWRVIFQAYSLVGIVWAVGFYWYFRTSPRAHSDVNQAELDQITASEVHKVHTEEIAENDNAPAAPPHDGNETKVPVGDLLLRMGTSLSMWGICVQSFFRAAGYVFFVTWFFAFLEYVYGIEKSEAGFLNSLPLIAVILGSLSGGVVVDWVLNKTGSKWISRCGIGAASLAICGLFTFASVWTNSATQLAVVIAIGAYFSGIGNPAAWTATIDVGGEQTAVVVGIMNMAGSLAGIVLPRILGEWFHQLRETNGDWDQVIYLHAAFYLAAAICWLVVNPNQSVDSRR